MHARLHAKLLQPTCDATLRLKAASFVIDGEAVITSDDGMSDFRALRKAARAKLTRPLTARANIDLDQYCLRSKCSGVVPTWRKFQCALWL